MGTTERSGAADCGLTLWLTGLSGAGKTTLALAIEQELAGIGRPACLLDGDELRRGLTSDLGLSHEDRSEQARRAAHVAALIARSGVIAIVALISPYAQDRRNAREIHAVLRLPFLEMWVNTPLKICERRDPKGLYARARAGELHDFTGLDAPYEPPQSPELQVEGYDEDPAQTAREIIGLLPLRRRTLSAVKSMS
jgi:bifunctional enzyme CysN/CysC